MMRYGFCFLSAVPVRREASHASEMVTQMLFGESMEVDRVEPEWVHGRMLFDGYEGWVSSKQLAMTSSRIDTDSGADRELLCVEPPELQLGEMVLTIPTGAGYCKEWLVEQDSVGGEEHDPVGLAQQFLGAPYLWGGRTKWGIDCSGLVQVVHKACGLSLPRDASQQAECGCEIDFAEARRGDLAFFGNEQGRLTHVGIVAGNGLIIHSSGRVRLDRLDEKGIVCDAQGTYSHFLHSVRRVES